MTSAALATALLVFGSDAEAPPAPRWAASVQVVGLLSRTLALQLERTFDDRRFSVLGGVSAGLPVGGDFGGSEWGLAAELRFWAWRPHAASAAGAFGWARPDVALTSLHTSGRPALINVDWGLSLGLGYRFVPFWRIELTPTAGISLVGSALAGARSAPAWAVRLQLGLAAGVVF